MREFTVKQLVQLNLDFYEQIGKYWNNDQNYIWEGWDLLFLNIILPQMKIKLTVDHNHIYESEYCFKILDLGCGNGRFGLYAFEQWLHLIQSQQLVNGKMDYVGVDFSNFYAELFQERMSAVEKKEKNLNSKFFRKDLIFDNWGSEIGLSFPNGFNLITLFGLMHHVPGYDNKLRILRNSTELLAEDGIICFTTWQFLLEKRLVKRVVPKSSVEFKALLDRYKIEVDDLEPLDYILNWVKKEKGYRFSHFINDDEAKKLINEAGLELVMEYPADGRFSQTNRYYVCRKIRN